MTAPFLALITPLASGGEPTHPIAPGGPPPVIWPGPNPPYTDIGGPAPQPPYPPQIWPGPKPPYIDAGPPGPQPGQPPQLWPGKPPYTDIGFPGPQPPGSPGAPPAPAVREADIPMHPDKPNPDAPGSWVLVALGAGNVGWAWMETPAQPPVQDQPHPAHPIS